MLAFFLSFHLLNNCETNILHSRLLSKLIESMKAQSLGEFEELVLLMVAALHDEAYGVSILENLEKETKKSINISAIHVALKRLENKGFLGSRVGGITAERGGRRKKYYVITSLGKQTLDKQFALRTRIYQQIPKISFN
jgi:DNA-binding PadR family transcriptional regulator